MHERYVTGSHELHPDDVLPTGESEKPRTPQRTNTVFEEVWLYDRGRMSVDPIGIVRLAPRRHLVGQRRPAPASLTKPFWEFPPCWPPNRSPSVVIGLTTLWSC